MLATLVTIAGTLILLYVLIKTHIYLIKKVWKPVWEEDHRAETGNEGETESNSGSEYRGWDEVR